MARTPSRHSLGTLVLRWARAPESADPSRSGTRSPPTTPPAPRSTGARPPRRRCWSRAPGRAGCCRRGCRAATASCSRRSAPCS